MKATSIRLFLTNKTRKFAALSLVEVAISLSIFAVAAIPLMGLLTHGVKTNKVSLEESTLSSILERAQSSLKAGDMGPLFFNFYGERTAPAESVFRVEILPSTIKTGDAAFGLISPQKYSINITNSVTNNTSSRVIAPFIIRSRDPVTL